jgi:hypothetical protein
MIGRIKAFEATPCNAFFFGKLNGDHPFTYEEALVHELNFHKKL